MSCTLYSKEDGGAESCETEMRLLYWRAWPRGLSGLPWLCLPHHLTSSVSHKFYPLPAREVVQRLSVQESLANRDDERICLSLCNLSSQIIFKQTLWLNVWGQLLGWAKMNFEVSLVQLSCWRYKLARLKLSLPLSFLSSLLSYLKCVLD